MSIGSSSSSSVSAKKADKAVQQNTKLLPFIQAISLHATTVLYLQSSDYCCCSWLLVSLAVFVASKQQMLR